MNDFIAECIELIAQGYEISFRRPPSEDRLEIRLSKIKNEKRCVTVYAVTKEQLKSSVLPAEAALTYILIELNERYQKNFEPEVEL